MKNLHLIIACIILFGFSTFFRKLALDRVHPFQLQIVAAGVYAVLIPFWIYMSNKVQATEYSSMGIGLIILCTVIHIIGAVAFGFLLKESNNVGVLSALVSLSPVVTVTLSMIFLGEQFSFWKVIAFLLALFSAILINF